MLKHSEFWLLTILAVIAAACALANMALFQGNRTVQAEVASRQQYVQQSMQLEVLYREIVKALADLSVRFQDPELTKLVRAHGVTFSNNAASAPAAPPAVAPQETK